MFVFAFSRVRIAIERDNPVERRVTNARPEITHGVEREKNNYTPWLAKRDLRATLAQTRTRDTESGEANRA